MTPRGILKTVRDRRIRTQALALAAASVIGAVVIALTSANDELATAAVLAAGIVVGELLVLRWPPAGELPLSYAVFPVVARALDLRYAVATIVLAELITLAGDERPFGSRWRVLRGIAVGASVVVVEHAAFAAAGHRESLFVIVGSLLVAIAVGSAVDASVRRAERPVQQTFWPERALYAWGAVLATGVLMAIAVDGVDGSGALGTRGALLIALPLVAVWWSFQHTDATSRMLQQTVDALAMVPVLAGEVELGAAARDAEVARRVGAAVGLTPDEQQSLLVAAQVQHVGAVTFDHVLDLTDTRARAVHDRTARATATILRAAPTFADAADIVQRAGTSRPAGQHDDRASIPANVLRTVTRYHAARTAGCDPVSALESLRAADADSRLGATIDALEHVILGERDARLGVMAR